MREREQLRVGSTVIRFPAPIPGRVLIYSITKVFAYFRSIFLQSMFTAFWGWNRKLRTTEKLGVECWKRVLLKMGPGAGEDGHSPTPSFAELSLAPFSQQETVRNLQAAAWRERARARQNARSGLMQCSGTGLYFLRLELEGRILSRVHIGGFLTSSIIVASSPYRAPSSRPRPKLS